MECKTFLESKQNYIATTALKLFEASTLLKKHSKEHGAGISN
jgi:hypothetical protein